MGKKVLLQPTILVCSITLFLPCSLIHFLIVSLASMRRLLRVILVLLVAGATPSKFIRSICGFPALELGKDSDNSSIQGSSARVSSSSGSMSNSLGQDPYLLRS
jgi:hypothetical protein